MIENNRLRTIGAAALAAAVCCGLYVLHTHRTSPNEPATTAISSSAMLLDHRPLQVQPPGLQVVPRERVVGKDQVDVVFEVSNTGSTPVRLFDLQPDCVCMATDAKDYLLPAGGTAAVTIAAKPLAYKARSGSVRIRTDNPDQPELRFRLQLAAKAEPPAVLTDADERREVVGTAGGQFTLHVQTIEGHTADPADHWVAGVRSGTPEIAASVAWDREEPYGREAVLAWYAVTCTVPAGEEPSSLALKLVDKTGESVADFPFRVEGRVPYGLVPDRLLVRAEADGAAVERSVFLRADEPFVPALPKDTPDWLDCTLAEDGAATTGTAQPRRAWVLRCRFDSTGLPAGPRTTTLRVPVDGLAVAALEVPVRFTVQPTTTRE